MNTTRENDHGHITLREAARQGLVLAIGIVIIAAGIIAITFFTVARTLMR